MISAMKKRLYCLPLLGAALVLIVPAASAKSSGNHAVSLGVRHHAAHSAFLAYPFDEGDLSYGLAYEYHEGGGYWQLALDYGAKTGELYPTDYVVTPQINLLFKDSYWRLGAGALTSYVRYEDRVVEANEAARVAEAEADAESTEDAEDSDEESDDDSSSIPTIEEGWTDVYWQFLAGASIPIGSLDLDILAAYPFKDWGDLGEFDSGDIEILIWLSFDF